MPPAADARAHDLRNAVNGIAVSLEALRTVLPQRDAGPGAARFLDAAIAQCEQAAALIGGPPAASSSVDSAPASSGSGGAIRSGSRSAPGGDGSARDPVRVAGHVGARRNPPGDAAGAGPGYIANFPSAARMTRPKILIADDERAIAAGLSAVLADLKYDVDVVADGEEALERLTAERYGLVLADLKMPRVDGLTMLKELQQRAIPTECIIITGQASIGSAVEAMQSGAYDYIEKPLTAEKLNRLKALIPKALDKYAVREQNRELSSQLVGLTHYAELTGASEPMREVYRIIDAVAPSTASVLILGESGTGKELVARALHSKSERAKGPFFALNCAALPKEILENELFGHEKGAFTGSTNEKPGAFEMASGGTLFLDEVAEMPPDIQVKLLRAIESRLVRRLGGKKEIAVDIRVVAATNKDLQQALADGELREDLYYRLAVVELYLPPLRERAGDIQLLANEFLARYAQQNGKAITGFDEAAMEWILTYSWPGNVRDLKNAVERAVVLARGPVITTSELMPRHLRVAAAAEPSSTVTLSVGSTLTDARRQLALRTLASTNGDVARAATILGIGAAELRSELAALLQDPSPAGASGSVARPVNGAAVAPVAPVAPTSSGAAAGPPAGVPAPAGTVGSITSPAAAPFGIGAPPPELATAGAGAAGRTPRAADVKTTGKKVAGRRTR